MIGLEDPRLVRSEVRLHEVVPLGWIVVLVVEPAVPPRRDFLGLLEPLSVICELDPAAGVLIAVLEVFVVAVAVLVSAHAAHEVLPVATLFMCHFVRLAAEEGAYHAVLAVDLPELRP